jgi:hypothetical protein
MLVGVSIQTSKSLRHIGSSMNSLAANFSTSIHNRSVAMYKGLTVHVYNSTKSEVTLVKQDLMDIIHVSNCDLV